MMLTKMKRNCDNEVKNCYLRNYVLRAQGLSGRQRDEITFVFAARGGQIVY